MLKFKVLFALTLIVASILTVQWIMPAGSWHTLSSTDDSVYEEFGPRPSELLISVYSDYASELAAFKNKEIDMMDWALEPIDYQWFETNDPLHEQYSTAFYNEFGTSQFDFNCQVMPTNLASVRKAIAHIIDKQYFIDTNLNGKGKKIDSALGSLPGWYNPACTDKYNRQPRTTMTPLPDDPQDWEAAYDLLLADLGPPVPDPDFPGDFMFTWPSPFPTWDPTATFPPVADGHLLVFARSEIQCGPARGTFLKEWLEEAFPKVLESLGKPRTRIHVDLYIIPRSFVIPQVMAYYRYHMYTSGWILTKETDFLVFYTTSMIGKPDPYSSNYVMYSNPNFDNEVDLMLTASAIGSPTNPCDAVYHAWLAQEIMENDEPVIWMWAPAGYKAYLSNWRGIVNEAGVTLNSWWTFMNAHKVGSESCDTIRYGWAGDLLSLNVISANWLWDWEVLNKVYDPLIRVNPYNMTDDRPWVASGWKIDTWDCDGSSATKITFHIRQDVWWQDVPYKDRSVGGGHLDASFTNMHLTPVDVAFSLEYLRDATPMPTLCPYLYYADHVSLNLNLWGSMWPYNATLPPWWNFPPEGWQYDFVQHEDIGAYDITVYFNVLMPWLALHWVGERPLIPMHVWMWIPIDGAGNVDCWAEDLVYGSGPWVLVDRTPGVSMRMIPFRNGQTYRGMILERSHFAALPVRVENYPQCEVGITGRKIIFKATFVGVDRMYAHGIEYYCSWGLRWGASWENSLNGTSPTFTTSLISFDQKITAYYVLLIPNELEWGNYTKIHIDLHWVVNNCEIGRSCNFLSLQGHLEEGLPSCKSWHPRILHVHPADLFGESFCGFPYFYSDGIVSIKDATPIGIYWMQTVLPGTDPTSQLAVTDINGDGIINIQDATQIGLHWQRVWTHNPPPP